jgi:hypothetical protein
MESGYGDNVARKEARKATRPARRRRIALRRSTRPRGHPSNAAGCGPAEPRMGTLAATDAAMRKSSHSNCLRELRRNNNRWSACLRPKGDRGAAGVSAPTVGSELACQSAGVTASAVLHLRRQRLSFRSTGLRRDSRLGRACWRRMPLSKHVSQAVRTRRDAPSAGGPARRSVNPFAETRSLADRWATRWCIVSKKWGRPLALKVRTAKFFHYFGETASLLW